MVLLTPQKKGRGPGTNSADILAPGLILQEQAERSVDHLVEGDLTQPAHDRVLLVKRLRVKPSGNLSFDLWNA